MISEEVVCVDDRSVYGTVLPVKEGHHYFVRGYLSCSCGTLYLDIGVSSGSDLICTKCYKRHSTSVWYFKSERFVPLSHVENINELRYETA